jgi:hypothetical protein
MERNAVTMHIVKTTIVFVIMVTMETHIWNAKVGHNNYTVLFHSLVIGYDDKLNWFGLVWVMVLNNISVIPWQSVLLVEETGVPGENH